MAYYLHRSPWWFHHFETLSNHFLELVVPFFLFLGRRMCILHGVLQILFQVGCARVPPLGVPVCLQKTRACLIISELAPRGVASSAPSHPLQEPTASDPGWIPGSPSQLPRAHGGVWLPSGSCLQGATQTLLRHPSVPHRHTLCSWIQS